MESLPQVGSFTTVESFTTANTQRKKASVGTVAIEDKQGKWRIRLPRTVAHDGSRYISTRLDATPENYRKVQRKVFEIEEDLEVGVFDITLTKYQFPARPTLALVSKNPAQVVELKALWDKYCEFMRPQLAPTTFKKEYVIRYTSHINNLPTQDITQSVVIRDHLLKTLSPYTAKRTLARISSCCAWAVKSKLISTNPFKELVEEIRLSKEDGDKIEPDPFTKEERDAILQGFLEHSTYSHYYSFIKFLFLTGCRTGEAIGLQWKHLSLDCRVITFCESYDSYLKLRKTTKTGKARKFPCNRIVQALLLHIRPPLFKPEDFVFTSTTGKPIDNNKFTSRVWRGGTYSGRVYKGIVTQLVQEGKVDHYRCLYNTRHTFITMALEGGMTVPQVAKLVGNSPEVIMKHYAGSALKFEVPVM